MPCFSRYLFSFLALLFFSLNVAAQSAAPQVAAGYYHTAALKNDGTVWTWGYNGFGQLGVGSLIDSNTPLQVKDLTGVRAITAGFFHTAALKSDGTVWTWGDNGYDQLGNGNAAYTSTPQRVAGLTGVTAIAAAGAHTLALKSDGTVWVWGWNAYGQLGIGSTVNARVPVQAPGLEGVAVVAAGFFHSLALRRDGTLLAWGYNGHGQLGDGTLVQANAPAPVSGLGGVTAITAGGGHTLALKSDGMVWAWGWNGFGQLGNGSAASSSRPMQVAGLSAAKAIATGFFHSLALRDDGTVRAWGHNGYGQLGNGTLIDASTPGQVNGVNMVAAIAANNNHSAALKNDGAVLSWGWNDDGQLGNGNRLSSTVPVVVLGTGGQGFLSLGIGSYQDLWSNPAEPGWGVGITQHGSTLFASWYTYDANGKPTWLVIPGGSWSSGTTFSGMLYSTSARNSGVPFTQTQVQVSPVGTADLNFSDANNASLSYRHNGVAGTKSLSRYVFDSSGNSAGVNRSDMWWAPSESGWGVHITQQFQTLFAGWYTYDASGKPTWLVLPGGSWISPTTYSGTLYRTASSATGRALDQGVVSTTAGGSATLLFSDADNAELRYVVDGVAGSKTITRLQF